MFNEEQGIVDFLAAIDRAAAEIRERLPRAHVTMVLADDGSSDRGPELALAFEPRSLDELRLLRLSRNFGHSGAVSALFDEALGFDCMVLMDADLQDTPALLPQLVGHWMEGYRSVRVLRGKRREGLLFSILSRIFYRFFKALSGLQAGLGNFGLYDAAVVRAVRSYPERVRYLPGIITLAGYETKLVTADRDARVHGDSRVGLRGLFRLAAVALFSFSTLPIQLMALLGFFFAAMAAVGAMAIVGVRLFTDLAIPGWASFLTAQFFFGGLIVFCLGVIGQYVGIIFEEVKARPAFFVHERAVRSFQGSIRKTGP